MRIPRISILSGLVAQPWPQFLLWPMLVLAAIIHQWISFPARSLRWIGVKLLNPKLPAQDLRGAVAVITGAETALGQRIALRLAERRAHVIMAVGDKEAGLAAFDAVRKELGPVKARLLVMYCDMDVLSSVERFVSAFKRSFSRLDVLVCAAGTNLPGDLTADGFSRLFQRNFLGHFFLCRNLTDLLESTAGARVVAMTSAAHRFGDMAQWEEAAVESGEKTADWATPEVVPRGFADAKLAVLLWAEELRRRFKEAGCSSTAVAVSPGVVKAEVWPALPRPLRLFMHFYDEDFFLSEDEACYTSVLAATAPLDRLIEMAKGNDPAAPDEPPLYLTPYWIPGGLALPFDIASAYIGAAATEPALPVNIRVSTRKLWELSERLLKVARTLKAAEL